jgi:hypothetical protein
MSENLQGDQAPMGYLCIEAEYYDGSYETAAGLLNTATILRRQQKNCLADKCPKSASRGLRDCDQDRKPEELWFDSRKGETILMFLKASGHTLGLTQLSTQ